MDLVFDEFGYNEQPQFKRTDSLHIYKMVKVGLQWATAYIEQFLLHVFTHANLYNNVKTYICFKKIESFLKS